MSENLKCIIVDDELPGRIVVRELLAAHCRNVEMAGEAGDIREALELIAVHHPDFIILDIQMPGGGGFELLKKLPRVDFDVIFVTSYDKYAISAIKFSALDYLLKPVDIDELKEAIEKVKIRKELRTEKNSLVINLLNNLDQEKEQKKIALHHQHHVKLVNLSDVLYLNAESNYTHVITRNKEKFTSARTLKDFEVFLGDDKRFMRINKSEIVNLDYIVEYSKGEPCIAYLSNGMEIEISRRRKTELMSKLKK